MASERLQERDLLVVGSGPVGSAIARVVNSHVPEARIEVVDAGPRLTARPGMHLNNIRNGGEREVAPPVTTLQEQATPSTPSPATGVKARPGTSLVDQAMFSSGMPAAAMSTNIGGMGAYWTCACPRPDPTERAPFISDGEWDRLLLSAEMLLSVTPKVFADSAAADHVLASLRRAYPELLAHVRGVQPMPLACVLSTTRRYWVGTDVVLGPLADEQVQPFTLSSDTLCSRLLVEGRRVVGAALRELPSGKERIVRTKVVAVAGDSLRTPQLLWASRIRPRALGRYLNDHIQILAAVPLSGWSAEASRSDEPPDADRTVGIYWIPYSTDHPSHGQVMHFAKRPCVKTWTPSETAGASVLGLGWFAPKEIRHQDSVTFLDQDLDENGMPRPKFHYALTDGDRHSIALAIADQRRVARCLGVPFTDDGEPQVLPAGNSLHYQGTVRMGALDDGASVCDADGRVWGLENLFVAGNGVIPTMTAGNPTLTSVALAIRSAEQIALQL